MSASANVRNVQVLADLKAALARFKSDTQSSLNAAQQEIQRAQEWLGERERHWQGEVRRREQVAQQAHAALQRCQASGTYDRDGHYYPPNCSAEEAALAQVQRSLSAAQAELRTVQQFSRALQQAAVEFQREAQRLANYLNNDVTKASALLENKISILQAYTAMSAPSVSYTSASDLRVDYSGAAFEQWAIANIFHDKQRIGVPVLLNRHLSQIDEEGLGLLQDRISDNYVDKDGSLWDAKAYDEHSVIDRDQLRDYQLMERAGYVIDAKGNRVRITSVNYLFSSRAAAEKNIDYLRGEATVWYVEWHSDGSGTVRLFEDQ
ncbi:MAG: hypothetical protein HY741_02335 [Chloroflexi bacterium]|nr:hypothetical protein [Chloroflexota bacterium]